VELSLWNSYLLAQVLSQGTSEETQSISKSTLLKNGKQYLQDKQEILKQCFFMGSHFLQTKCPSDVPEL
jgi:hypothetical protein